MRNLYSKRPASLTAVVYLLLLTLTSGCDTLGLEEGGNSIFLSTTTGEICFRFSGLTAGGSQSVLSVESFDFGSFLQQEGFSKSEVIAATVQSADIRLVFPLGESLSVLDRATVSLRGTGAGETSVAEGTAFSSSRSASLDVTGTGVGSAVKASSIQGVLQLVGAETISDDFEISVNLTIQIEVEGV